MGTAYLYNQYLMFAEMYLKAKASVQTLRSHCTTTEPLDLRNQGRACIFNENWRLHFLF